MLTAVALTFNPNVCKIYPCQNEWFASDNGAFRSCDRYLNSGANLLKLTEVEWLYLALLIHANYHCFHSLKLYKVCNIYPRSIKSLIGIVLTVTNLTKVLWSLTTIDLLISIKVSVFWT